ncbi:MAG: class I SAM-dependent methyltransferase [Flavobacteriales bacterium]|nr:class I SAM-dependent methyltransferase [Flavobacteriales bacterium]
MNAIRRMDIDPSFGPMAGGVALLEAPGPFGGLYNEARAREGRILDDRQVSRLPQAPERPHRAEWQVRARSAQRLVEHPGRSGRSLRVLDVGCGNGWLSALLARQGHAVLGIDRHLPELQQAARVFGDGPRFALADLFHPALDGLRFDVVLFAASFQYFADARATLRRARALAPSGEVHVMDTMLYPDADAAAAASARSAAYYAALGVPQLAANYHAHALCDVQAAGPHHHLRRPGVWKALMDRINGIRDPFHHVVLFDTVPPASSVDPGPA